MLLALRALGRWRIASACLLVTLLLPGAALAACQGVGDSIMAGLAGRLPCRVAGIVGISTRRVLGVAEPGYALTIVSAGSNDGGAPATMDAIRARVGGRMVVILPSDHPRTVRARAIVAAWARERGVPAVSFDRGRNSFHPANYGRFALSLRISLGL